MVYYTPIQIKLLAFFGHTFWLWDNNSPVTLSATDEWHLGEDATEVGKNDDKKYASPEDLMDEGF